MDLTLSHCTLPVDDHDKAVHFYHDILGFEIRSEVAFEDMRWVTISPPGQPDIQIVLEPPFADPSASPGDKQAIAELMAKGLMRRLVFTTADCNATFEHIRAAGGEVVQEPMDQPYGVRDCAFRDPSGNLLRINQNL